MMLTKFDSSHTLAFIGRVEYTIKLQLHERQILISDSSESTEMFIDIGGDSNSSCALSSKKGIVMKLNASSHSFKYESSTLRFRPRMGLRVYIPYQVSGGRVVTMETSNYLMSLLQPFKRTIPLVNREIWNIQKRYPIDQVIITHHSKKLVKALKKLSTVLLRNINNYKEIYVQLNIVKSILFDMNAALKSFKSRLYNNSRVHSLIDKLLNNIQNLQEVKLDYLITEIKMVDYGVFTSFTGEFCLHQLCISNALVSIQDVYETDDCYTENKADHYNHVYIEVIPRKLLNLSTRLWMNTGQKLSLYLDKKTGEISGHMNVTILFLNEEYSVELNVLNSSTYFITPVRLHSGFMFNIKGSIPLHSAKWTSLTSRIEGESIGVQHFSQEVQNYYTINSQKTIARKNVLDYHARRAFSNYKQKKVKLIILKKYFEEAKRKHARASAIRIGAELLLTYKEKESLSYLNKHPLLKNIVIPNVNAICLLTRCAMKYIHVPFCEICKDEVIKVVDSLKCDEQKQLLNTRILVSFETHCTVINNTLTPVYSGSCPTNPSSQRKLEKQFIASDPSLRILLNKNITGAVVDIVQAINGIFLSCVKSHENITEKYTVQQPCTRNREENKTIKQQIWKCYYVKSRIQTNRTTSKKCKCESNGYTVNISQTECMLKNNECELKRLVYLKKSANIPQYYANLALSIYVLKARVKLAVIDIERQRKNKLFYQNQYYTTEGLLYNSRMESLIANNSKKLVTSLLTKELCLMNKYKSSKNLSDIFVVKAITFYATLPIITNIVMNVEIVRHVAMETITIPLLYDLNDRLMSFKSGAKTLVQKLLCFSSEKAGRKVRSIKHLKANTDNNLLFSSWYVDNQNNQNSLDFDSQKNVTFWYINNQKKISKYQKACISLQTVMNFLSVIATTLTNITQEAISLQEVIQQNDVISTFSSDINYTNYQTIIKAQNILILSVESDINRIKKTAEIENILLESRQQLEVHVSIGNYTVCFSFDDCVNVAFETLQYLPTIFTVTRRKYINSVLQTSDLLRSIMSYTGKDLNSFLYLIKSYKKQLQYTCSLCLHCSDKPVLKDIVGNQSTLEVMVGEHLSINCLFRSFLPVKVYWMKDDHVIDRENNEKFTILSTLSDSGVYKCLIVSVIGLTISNSTIVIVYNKPRLYNQPTTMKYLYPSFNANATFVCNATGDPKPIIKWFFSSYDSYKFKELKGENAPLLSVTNPDQSKGGFYYCSAVNKYGSVSSGKVRLDLLQSNIAKQKMSLSVDTESLHSSMTFTTLEKILTLHRGLDITVKHKLLKNVTRLQVGILFNPNVLKKLYQKAAMIDLASLSRQYLAISSALFVSKMLNKSIENDEETRIEVYDNSLIYEHNFKICETGYKVDGDGFTCGKQYI